MRLHISLDDDLVEALDARVGPRRRSRYIVAALRRALDDDLRWDEIEQAMGSVDDESHAWDADPAGWVRAGRRGDHRRVG